MALKIANVNPFVQFNTRKSRRKYSGHTMAQKDQNNHSKEIGVSSRQILAVTRIDHIESTNIDAVP